jgi:hypothetical protein
MLKKSCFLYASIVILHHRNRVKSFVTTHNFMKKILTAKFAKLALTLGLGSLALVGCQKEEVAEKPQLVQESAAERTARIEADNKLLAEALKGGLEMNVGTPEKGASSQMGNLDTRVLINGSIVGFGVSGYNQPYVSTAGNLMAHIPELLRRYEYNVSVSGNTLTATRSSGNTFGAQTITLTNGSTTANFRAANGVNTSTILPQAPVITNGVFFAPARILAILAGAAIAEWDADTKSLQTHYYEVNDFGIYFYGTQQNTNAIDQVAGNQKYIAGEPNAFFDPNKPTIIYAHGWQKGGVSGRGREGFLFNLDNQFQNVQNYWRNAGWNVGIFHWVQTADDDWGLMPVDTEKKIYDVNNPNRMRWKKSDGNFSTRGNPTLNVTQLYRQEYQRIIGVLSTTAELRLIGNSLGANLTMAMLREVNINGNRLPARVTLSDPYWDPSLDGSDGITLPAGLANTKAVGANAAQRLNNAGVALEYFRTSIAGQQGYNAGVANIAAYVNFVPGYTSDPAAKHTQPHKQYMWNLAFNPPATGPSPRTSNTTVRNMMATQLFWDHTGGTATATPADDVYTVRSGKPQ